MCPLMGAFRIYSQFLVFWNKDVQPVALDVNFLARGKILRPKVDYTFSHSYCANIDLQKNRFDHLSEKCDQPALSFVYK